MSDQEISDIISTFNDRQWQHFMHNQLGMEQDKIDEIEDLGLEVEQLKLKAAKEWAAKHLRELKHEFFCHGVFLPTESALKKSSEVQIAQSNRVESGLVLIISNSKENHRDAEIMKDLWEKEFKCSLFKKDIQTNKTASQMRELFDEMARENVRRAYMVIVVISNVEEATVHEPSQGAEYLTGSDGDIVEITHIKHVFKNSHDQERKVLHGVPKIFIFKGCRGIPFRVHGGKSNKENTTVGEGNLIPEMSDMLCIYPPITKPEKDENEVAKSFQRASNARRFIKELDRAFRQYGREKHVVDIVARLNREMALQKPEDAEYQGDRGATCCVSTLSKQLFLFRDACSGIPPGLVYGV